MTEDKEKSRKMIDQKKPFKKMDIIIALSGGRQDRLKFSEISRLDRKKRKPVKEKGRSRKFLHKSFSESEK